MDNSNIDRKVIVINESMAEELKELVKMTRYKFDTAVKKFIHDLLVDPTNAVIPPIFKLNGYNRSKLLGHLKKSDLIRKIERISDKDENGEPKTATMIVKYAAPKKDFDKKLRNLFISLFERNLPERQPKQTTEMEIPIEETTACCGDGGFDGMGGQGAAGGAFLSNKALKNPNEEDPTLVRHPGFSVEREGK